jgi:hypothetical protein
MPTSVSIVKLSPPDVDAAKDLIQQYLVRLGINLFFQNIEEELADFPGMYREPEGVFLVASPEPVQAAWLCGNSPVHRESHPRGSVHGKGFMKWYK